MIEQFVKAAERMGVNLNMKRCGSGWVDEKTGVAVSGREIRMNADLDVLVRARLKSASLKARK